MGRFSTCALVLLAAVPVWCAEKRESDAPQSDPLRFLRPDAGLIAGVQWKRLVHSPSGETLRKEIKKTGLGPLQGMEALEKLIFEDIESLVLATTLKEPAKVGSETPMLMVVKGRFAASLLKPFLGGKGTPEVHRGVEVMTPANMKPPSMRFALLDDHTLLAGDRMEVLAAIDRRARAVVPAISKRADALAARFDLWIMAEAPPRAGKPQGSTMAGFEEFLDQVKSFEAGMVFTEGLGLDVNVLTKSVDAASRMAQNLQGLLAVAGMTKEGAEMGDVLQKIRVGADASQVKMSLALDKADMDKLMQKAQARATLASSSAPAQPPRPARTTIRIEGLDGGPLEIQSTGK